MKGKNQLSVPSKYWLLIITTICIIFIGLSLVSDKTSGPFKVVADYTVVPMQKGINRAGMFLNDLTENFDTLQDVKAENKSLKKKVDSLTISNNRLQQEKYELERLRELYKLDQTYSDYEKIGAHVIGNNGSNWFSTFTIDKGSEDGIKVDMNVMAGAGLVGIVTKVGPHSSEVRAIIDDQSNVSGMVLSTSDTCVVRGDLKLLADGRIRFEQLAKTPAEEHIDMRSRREVINFCLKLKNSYEDYPFEDPNWTVMRHKENQKVFAWIFQREGHIWVNVKCDPQWREFWREAFPSVIPGYHLNKMHWNSIILDGTVPDKDIKRMVQESYDLTAPKKRA